MASPVNKKFPSHLFAIISSNDYLSFSSALEGMAKLARYLSRDGG